MSSPPKPPQWLSQPQSAIAAKHADLKQRETERLGTSEGQFYKHLIAHAKNRWPTPQPYLHNRVILHDSPSGDYFNASHITLGHLNYIATQNPTCIPEFWQMAHQQNISVIVMLMPFAGSGDDRCARYYPQHPGEVITAGRFEITLKDKPVEYMGTEIRELLVSDRRSPPSPPSSSSSTENEEAPEQEQPRTVWHLAFLDWPDHSVPTAYNPRALLTLLKLSRKYGLQPDAPRLVHCSAGCGRTGTFIALDYLLEEMEQGAFDEEFDDQTERDPVFEVVGDLKAQRVMMVEKENQLGLLYKILRWRWESKAGVGLGGEEGTGEDWTFVRGVGAKRSQRKGRWEGLPRRGESGG